MSKPRVEGMSDLRSCVCCGAEKRNLYEGAFDQRWCKGCWGALASRYGDDKWNSFPPCPLHGRDGELADLEWEEFPSE